MDFREFPLCVTLMLALYLSYQVKDSELNPVINRDLSRRVRPVAGFTVAKQIVRDDIKLAARIIRELDKKSRLYEIEKIEEVKEKEVVEVS